MSLKDYGIICDDSVKYSPKDEKIIVEFRDRFYKIKSMGYVKSHRKNNTGIGKTFEDLIGVQENNIPNVDFMNLIEIKAKRAETSSMLTLFTKSPDYPDGCNTYLRDKYGMTDPASMTKKIHTTVTAVEFNNLDNKFGFKLECSDSDERIYLLVKNLQTNRIVERSVYYSYSTLKKIISSKCANIAYVKADSKTAANGSEYFKYTSAQLLTGCTFNKFLKAVKKGSIKYDIRIGTYKSGKSIGKAHDHGSGFRIMNSQIPELFKVTDL